MGAGQVTMNVKHSAELAASALRLVKFGRVQLQRIGLGH